MQSGLRKRHSTSATGLRPGWPLVVTEVAGFGRSASWCIVMAMAMGAGAALAQTRAWVGGIQPATHAALVREEAGAPSMKVTDRVPKMAVKHRIHKSKPKGRIKRQPKAKTKVKPQLRAEPRLKTPANLKVVLPKSRRVDNPRQSVSVGNDSTGMESRWQEIQTTLRPASLIVLCEQFERDFAASRFAHQVGVVAASARHALEIQRSAGLSGDFFEDAVGDSGYRENLRKAVRGDKDAAYNIALAYKTGTAGVDASPRRMEQWLHFSAELGSGVASWELAEIYNRDGFIADVARFEKKALDLGYQPPPRLPTRGY